MQLFSTKNYLFFCFTEGRYLLGLLDVSTQRLDEFCAKTPHYAPNAERFRRIVGRVEAQKIPPERVAALAATALTYRHPRDVYAINRNPLLLLLNALPDRMQRRIIRAILQTK